MTRRRNVAGRLLTSLALCAGVTAAPAAALSGATAATAVPTSDGATHFVDQAAKLAGFNDPQWYRANIPFLDVPDAQIEAVYYYRWRTWKEHLRYTDPADGWISTEFLDCCGYAAPYQAINAAAGFHIAEGRWVRDQTYTDDYVRFWLTGPGRQPQSVNPDAPDWAHEYSFWAATAALQDASVTGDVARLRSLQGALVHQYRAWDSHFDSALGLYWQVPVWDAKEFSPATYESSNPFAGVHTFRPSINAYQYGDALAIAQVARLNGDGRTAAEYTQRATALKANAHKWLWDPQRQFWYDIVDENNPTHQRLDTREETGFVPWQFDLAASDDSPAWRQILDPQGFAAPYGPTTVERRSPWFMAHAREGCCHWDGPSWPYSTSQELTGLANQLDDYPAQNDINAADYTALLHTFAATQYRNGQPYVAEAHDPDQPNWIYDGYNHSEDYNHSSFDDLVISGLIGIRPSLSPEVTIKPLAPWDHFALENTPYHGHNLTVLYDRDGTHYGAGTGFAVYVDGRRVVHQNDVGTVQVSVGGTVAHPPSDLVNDAANPLRTGYPRPIASYTSPYDDPWSALDGKTWFTEVPENTRWTNYASPNAQDYYGVDFGAPITVDDVRFYGYDDGGGVQPAKAYTLQYWTGSAWADVPGQAHTPSQPVGNGLNQITFAPLITSQLRLLFTNPAGAFVGVTELQAWRTSTAGLDVVAPTETGGATTVRATFTGHAQDLALQLRTAEGWQVRATSPTSARTVARTFTATWQVTPPPDAVPGSDGVLLTYATWQDHGAQEAHRRTPISVRFEPAWYSHVLVDDQFATDTSVDYHPNQPFPASEVVPALTAGGGRLTASADQRYFALFDRGVAPASNDAVVIIDPARFVGTNHNEDTFFLGLVKDADNYVATWYNNTRTEIGADVRVGGNFPAFGKSGYGNHPVVPGDRLAEQVHGTQIATYLEHAGAWQRIGSFDVGSLVTAGQLAQYHVAVGFRADSGALQISRFQALSH